MKWSHVQEIIIAEGLRSVEEYEEDPVKRTGCRQGFALVRKLKIQEDFEACLEERHQQESRMATAAVGRGKRKEYQAYWRHRCATLQVEHVYHRFRAFHGLSPVSARAVMHVEEILSRMGA